MCLCESNPDRCDNMEECEEGDDADLNVNKIYFESDED